MKDAEPLLHDNISHREYDEQKKQGSMIYLSRRQIKIIFQKHHVSE